MTTPDIAHWMKVCVAVAQIFTPLIAFGIFIVTVMLAARSKQADILVECHRRHADLVSKAYGLRRREEELQNASAKSKYRAEVKEWFGSFWRQQDDQYVHWRNGFIEDHIYMDWIEARLRELKSDKQELGPFLGEMTYKDGYDSAASEWCSDDFKKFMNLLWETRDAQQTVQFFRPRGLRVSIIRFLCNNRRRIS